VAATHHEAALWKPADGGYADCFLCAHRCHIAPGKIGVCQVRRNEGGRLVSLVYGRVIAHHVDPIEKKPLFHFLPGSRAYSIATVGCNFQCGFCQNWQISQWPRSGAGAGAASGDMPGEPMDQAEVVAEARQTGCASVSYTYTEPTIFFEFARDCGLLACQAGLKNSFVTNGYQTPETIEAMAGWVHAANVDLKAWSDEFYKRLCKARVEPVKEAIRLMHAAGIHVEVTTLLVPGENDAPDHLKAIAEFLAGISPDLVWHVTRFHPDFDMQEKPPTPVGTIEQAIRAGREAGLRYVYAGNIAGRQDTRCPGCGTVVIERPAFGVTNLRAARPAPDGRHMACGHCGKVLPIIVAEPRE
jgi:pyruvate formate lyase activating enzyme